MDFVRKRKENYNTAQTTAIVDVDWRVSFPCPLTPKDSLLQSLLSTFSDFNHRSLKKSSKPTNCAISFHQNLSPTATSWKAGWCLQECLTDQSLLRHICFPKGLSGYLLISSESSAVQQQMKGRHLASTKLLQDCAPQLPTQSCTSSCLAPSLLTRIPEIWMSAGQRQQCCLQLGLTHVGHPASFLLWHTSSASSTSLRL